MYFLDQRPTIYPIVQSRALSVLINVDPLLNLGVQACTNHGINELNKQNENVLVNAPRYQIDAMSKT